MKKVIIILVGLAVLLSGCIFSEGKVDIDENLEDTEDTSYIKEYNQSLFYEEKDFYSTMNVTIENTFENTRGIICPHHLLASELLHEVFIAVEDRDSYDLIVIVGPDHNTVDSKNIYTTNLDWITPFGDVKIDDDKLQILKEYPNIKVNNTLIEREHSNAALMHFVSYYFKNAKVVNIAITGTLDMNESLDFSDYLDNNILDENTLLIASIDFSHYLDYDRANTKDEETLKEIQERNFVNIMNFNNDNVDSPQTLVAFLEVMNRLDGKLAFINNKNSYDIISVDKDETTSYFSLIYN